MRRGAGRRDAEVTDTKSARDVGRAPDKADQGNNQSCRRKRGTFRSQSEGEQQNGSTEEDNSIRESTRNSHGVSVQLAIRRDQRTMPNPARRTRESHCVQDLVCRKGNGGKSDMERRQWGRQEGRVSKSRTQDDKKIKKLGAVETHAMPEKGGGSTPRGTELREKKNVRKRFCEKKTRPAVSRMVRSVPAARGR